MSPLLISAIISGIVALVGTGASIYSSNKNNKSASDTALEASQYDAQMNYQGIVETNKASKEIAKMNNDYNTEMWNKQNEYNSPTATMQRLVEAGINPRAYQQIGQFANAGTPQPAQDYEQKSPLFALANKVQKEELKASLAESKERISASKLNTMLNYTEMSLNSFYKGKSTELGFGKLEEQKSHNDHTEEMARIYAMMESDEFRIELARHGIQYDPVTRQFTVPTEDIRLEERTKHRIFENLRKTGLKIDTERDYLELKKTLETINTGNKTLDSLLKVLGLIIN